MIQDSPILLASNSTASSSSTSLASIPTHPSSPLQRKWSLRRQTQKLSGVNLISRTIAAAANGNAKGKDDESEEVDEGLWDNNDEQFQADLRDEDESSLPTATFASARDSSNSFSSYEEVMSTRERLSFLGTSLPIQEESGSEIPTTSYASSSHSKSKRPDTAGSSSSNYAFNYHYSGRSPSVNGNSTSRPLSVSSSLFSNGNASGGGATLSSPSEASSALTGYPSPSSGSSRMESDKEWNAFQQREKEKEKGLPTRPGGGIRRTASATINPTSKIVTTSPTSASSDPPPLPLPRPSDKTTSQPQSPVVALLSDKDEPILLSTTNFPSPELPQQHLGLTQLQTIPNGSEKSPRITSFDVSFPSPDARMLSLDASDPTPRSKEVIKEEGVEKPKESTLFEPLNEEALQFSTLPPPELGDNALKLGISSGDSPLHRAHTLSEKKEFDPIHSADRRPSLPVSSLYTRSARNSPSASPEFPFNESSANHNKGLSTSTSASGLSKLSKLKKSSSSKSVNNLKSKGISSSSPIISEMNKAGSHDEGLDSYSRFASAVTPTETIEEEKLDNTSSPKKGKIGFKAGLMKLVGGNSSHSNSNGGGISNSHSFPANLPQATKKESTRKRTSTANSDITSNAARNQPQTRRNQVTDDIQVIGEYDATYGIPTFSNFGASRNSGIKSPLDEGPSFGAYAIPSDLDRRRERTTSARPQEIRTSQQPASRSIASPSVAQQVGPASQKRPSIPKDQSFPSNPVHSRRPTTADEVTKWAMGVDQTPSLQGASGNGSRRDSRSHTSQSNREGRTRTTSIESLNGILRSFTPRPSSSSGTGIGQDSNHSRRKSVIEHTSFDELRRNSTSRGPTVLSGEQLELLRSGNNNVNHQRPTSPSQSLNSVRSPARPSRGSIDSRPGSAQSSFAAMEGGGSSNNFNGDASSPNTLANSFNAAHSQRWSTFQSTDPRSRGSIMSSSDFSPSQESFQSNAQTLSGSFSGRAPSVDRFPTYGNEFSDPRGSLRRLANASMEALPFVSHHQNGSVHSAGRRPSLGAITPHQSSSSSSKRWSSLWNAIPGTAPAPSPRINISRPLSSSSSFLSEPEGSLSFSSPQVQGLNRLNSTSQFSPRFEKSTLVNDDLVSPKTQVFKRPSTSDAIYEKGFTIPPNSSISLAAATSSSSSESHPAQRAQSQLLSRPITADQVFNNKTKRRPSFGLHISPAAAAAFDSIPIPSPRSNENHASNGVTGLGLSVSSAGVSNGESREEEYDPQERDGMNGNSAFASSIRERHNLQLQNSTAGLSDLLNHDASLVADAPVTPASEEEKELLDLELLDDSSPSDGIPIDIEIDGNSPLINTESLEGRNGRFEDESSDRGYGFV